MDEADLCGDLAYLADVECRILNELDSGKTLINLRSLSAPQRRLVHRVCERLRQGGTPIEDTWSEGDGNDRVLRVKRDMVRVCVCVCSLVCACTQHSSPTHFFLLSILSHIYTHSCVDSHTLLP